jgi:hypothetical protein
MDSEIKVDDKEIEQLFLPIQKRYLDRRQEILNQALENPDLDIEVLIRDCEDDFAKEIQEAFEGYVQRMGEKHGIPQSEIDKAIADNMPGISRIQWSFIVPLILFLVLVFAILIWKLPFVAAVIAVAFVAILGRNSNEQ